MIKRVTFFDYQVLRAIHNNIKVITANDKEAVIVILK